jgi:hypothetical protein
VAIIGKVDRLNLSGRKKEKLIELDQDFTGTLEIIYRTVLRTLDGLRPYQSTSNQK